jgi:ribosomal protein S18 acetylase RimI-like enzyme
MSDSNPGTTRHPEETVIVRPFVAANEAAVIALWERCGLTRPWNDPRKDIRRKLAVRPDLFLVGALNGVVVASVMAGYEGHRGWINYLAVAPEHQGKGFGRAMMAEAEHRLREAGCPKINLQVRSANTTVVEFYQRLGYTVDDVVSLGKRLEHDEADPA